MGNYHTQLTPAQLRLERTCQLKFESLDLSYGPKMHYWSAVDIEDDLARRQVNMAAIRKVAETPYEVERI